MQAGAAAIELLQSNTELARPHTVGFSLNRPGSPFYEGVYVLLPSENTNISDLMDKYYLGGDAQLLSRAEYVVITAQDEVAKSFPLCHWRNFNLSSHFLMNRRPVAAF